MLPRECDNDECDYDTYVDGQGRAGARWEHAPGCRASAGGVDGTDSAFGSGENRTAYMEARY